MRVIVCIRHCPKHWEDSTMSSRYWTERSELNPFPLPKGFKTGTQWISLPFCHWLRRTAVLGIEGRRARPFVSGSITTGSRQLSRWLQSHSRGERGSQRTRLAFPNLAQFKLVEMSVCCGSRKYHKLSHSPIPHNSSFLPIAASERGRQTAVDCA
jgi:hypothetical protein